MQEGEMDMVKTARRLEMSKMLVRGRYGIS
jgi:hypothetical protein